MEMGGLIDRISRIVVGKRTAHAIVARLLKANGELHELSNTDGFIELEAGESYFCDFAEPQEVRYGRGKSREKAVVKGECLFSVNGDFTMDWSAGTWMDGVFRGTFSDGSFIGGTFAGTSIGNSTFDFDNVQWRAEIGAWKDGNSSVDGKDASTVAPFRGRLVRTEGEIVSEPCDRDGFSGTIIYGDTMAVVKDATFSLRESSIEWKGGSVTEGEIAMEGEFRDFTGNVKVDGAKFSATSASFRITMHSGKAVIRWFSGDWNNGVWTTGIWEGGTWHDGTWKFGNWIPKKESVWMTGKDRNGNVHDESPDKWLIATHDSGHIDKDHLSRNELIYDVILKVCDDPSIFAIWYQNEKIYGESANVLYNSGLYVCYSLDNPMLNGLGDVNEKTGIPHILNMIHHNFISLDLERQLVRDNRFATMIEALDLKENEDGSMDVVPILKPRPAGFELSRGLKEKALLHSLQEGYNSAQIDSIRDFATNPVYRKVWSRKLDEIHSKSDEEFASLYDEVLTLEHAFVFLHKPNTRKNLWWRFSSKRERKLLSDFFIGNGFFKSEQEIANFAGSKAIDELLLRKYRSLMDGRDVWK